MSNQIDTNEALEVLASEARKRDLKAKIVDNKVHVGRVLSRGRFQNVGWIELVDDGDAITVDWGAFRIRATIRDIANTLDDFEIVD